MKNQPIDYQNIVKKYTPEDARLTTDRGYVIPDNNYIFYILRRKVRSLR